MASLFGSKHSASAGWLAVALHPDRIDVARVEKRTSGRPAVRVCESMASNGSPAEALSRLRRSLKPRGLRCTSLLGAGQYQMQLVEAPAVPAAEVKQAVRWKLKDLLDYPVDAATVDVAPVPSDAAGIGRAQYVYAVSARNEQIGERMRLFHDARFPLEAIDVPEMAQRNVAQLFEDPNRGLAMLVVGHGGGMLTFTSGGRLYLSRRTDIALAQLTAPGAEAREQARERLVLELQRSIDHFDRQFGFVTLSRLLLAPLPPPHDLQPYLAEHLYLPVQTLDLAEAIDFPGAPQLRDPKLQTERLHLLGAALREE
jgi:MSHA biogenesis protein MshI